MAEAFSKIRPRRGTLAEWSAYNPVLLDGELVIELPPAGTALDEGFYRFKIGNGYSRYSELPYAFAGDSTSNIFGGGVDQWNIICIRSGTSDEWEAGNPVLENGEIAFDKTEGRIKVGDGETLWNDLDFVGGEDFDYDFGDEDEILAARNNT